MRIKAGRRGVLAAIAGGIAAGTAGAQRSAETVVPVLRLLPGMGDDTGLLRQEFRALAPADPSAPLVDTFVADLSLAYAAESAPERFLTEADLPALGLSRPELREKAVANWTRLRPKPEVQRIPGPVYVVEQRLAASLLLEAPLWDGIATELGGQLILAVPARDLLLFASDSLRTTGVLLRALNAVHAGDTPHKLSRRRLGWRDGAWEVAA